YKWSTQGAPRKLELLEILAVSYYVPPFFCCRRNETNSVTLKSCAAWMQLRSVGRVRVGSMRTASNLSDGNAAVNLHPTAKTEEQTALAPVVLVKCWADRCC